MANENDKTTSVANALAEAETRLEEMRQTLPSQLSVRDLNVWSMLPYKSLVVRGALLWRTVEQATEAVRLIRENKKAAALLLCRAVIENAAVHWRLWDLLKSRDQISTDQMDQTLQALLMGWRSDPEFPQAINVLTLVDRLDREVSGVRRAYDTMSEVAHPNYGGVHGLFAKNDHDKRITFFGDSLRGAEMLDHGALAFSASLGLQSVADSGFSRELVEWLSSLPKLDDPTPPDEDTN